MKHQHLPAILALSLLALAGCKTTLNGGGNEGGGSDGGTGGDDAVLASSSSGADTGSTGAGGTFVTGSSGGSGECPDVTGVPEPTELFVTDRVFVSMLADEDTLYLGSEGVIAPADPPRLLEVDKVTGATLVTNTLESPIQDLIEVDGVLYGSGRCNGGGDPYRIQLPGPTITPLSPGCEENPTFSLVEVGGGIAYGTHDGQTGEVRWAPLSGAGPTRVLATFPWTGGNNFGPFITDMVTDGTVVYAVANYTGNQGTAPDGSWGEIWRIPLDGGERTHVVSTVSVPPEGMGYTGGIAGIVLDGDAIYFAEVNSGTIWRIGTDGSNPELVWQGNNQIIGFTDAGSDLAFIDLALPEPSMCTPILRRMPKGGNEAVPVSTSPDFPQWELASDGSDLFFQAQDSAEAPDFPMMVFRAPGTP